ncbi:MAG: translation initiation factor IF-2 [Nanoarchaeota archaeon]
MTQVRSPICVVLGHVDHGKSSILDWIRRTSVVSSEKGAITQAIGASVVPLQTIKRICGPLLDHLKTKLSISGLLFIDTPGHEAFTSLRRRGGSIADIAVLCVDINEGFKPQTIEALEMLRQFKVPFIVAANKIDLVPGWRSNETSILQTIASLPESVQTKIDTKIYELVGKLSESNIQSERFDRIENFTKQIAIVPTSAKTGEGLPELLMVLTGMTQRFLENCLRCDLNGPARGTILEVKEEEGLGCCLDVILYDGTLRVDDTIVVGTMGEPIITKVRALLEPESHAEMRDAKSKFRSVHQVKAATGVRISAPGLIGTVSGMPIQGAGDDVEAVRANIAKEVSDVLIETDAEGIVIKADSLGSLEAMIKLLKNKNVPIRKASVGRISKKDVVDAETNKEKHPLLAVVLGFNVDPLPEAAKYANIEHVEILTDPVIYKLLEHLEKWQVEQKRLQDSGHLTLRPCKVEIMKGYVFRQSNPAIVGIDILAGTLKTGMVLTKQGPPLTTVRALQHEKEHITSIEAGKQVAASLDKVTMGRQLMEGDVLLSFLTEDQFRMLKKIKHLLTEPEIALLREIALLMRKDDPVWGV